MKRVLSLLLIVVTLLVFSSCGGNKNSNLKVEDIHAVCELATIKCYYNNVGQVVKEKDNFLQKDRKMWIEYEGKATIGIKMSSVVIEINGETVSITMPKAEILSTDYTFNENSYISSADGWLVKNEISTEEQQAAVVAAQEAMKQSILSNDGLFIKAEARAKALIENYINKLGEATGQEYTIKWNR